MIDLLASPKFFGIFASLRQAVSRKMPAVICQLAITSSACWCVLRSQD